MRLNPWHALFRMTPFPTSGLSGSGTTNEIAYFTASTTVGSLTTATYPSLTELSYVKGVTSAIQTQLTAKAPSTSPTFATSITGSYLTASEILITDGSKNIVSAPVATYPSLTELTYVKGVTSAIQTQINTKANTAGALTQFVGNGNWKVWYSDGSGDVTELALGASGTVLTSGGASSAPSFATPGGGDDNFSTTYYIYSSGFGGAAGSSTGTSGGSLTDGGVGYVGLNTSTTAGSAETTWVYRGGTVDYSKNMWGRLQMTRFLIETTTAAAQTHATMFNFTNDSTTLATKYAGWRIEGGNPATWYAVVKNGTTETASSGLSSMPASNTFGTYILDVIYTSSSITYYYNGTLKATLTTNIPTGSTATSDNTLFQGKIKNGTDAIDANIRFNAFTAKITL